MPRTVRIALAFVAAVSLSTLAIVGACALDSDDALLRLLLAQNKASQTRMDAFDLRLKIAADRVLGSICHGCLSSARKPAVARPRVVVTRAHAIRRHVRHHQRRSYASKLARDRTMNLALADTIGLRSSFTSLHRPPREASALPLD